MDSSALGWRGAILAVFAAACAANPLPPEQAPSLPAASPATDPGRLPPPRVDNVMRNLTAADQGKTIDMSVGQKIAISLIGIPTAGYTWGADRAPPGVKVSEGPGGPTIAAQNQPGYTGGRHWQVIIVEATAAGEGELALAMRRPWEKSSPPAETFSIRLQVK